MKIKIFFALFRCLKTNTEFRTGFASSLQILNSPQALFFHLMDAEWLDIFQSCQYFMKSIVLGLMMLKISFLYFTV